MNQNNPLFLTTAIPYVNAAPHIGHAFELLIGDAYTRHQRQRGRPVHFTGGTDDHSLKNVRAAEALGEPPEELVARQGRVFAALARALGVEFDDYLHTSSDPRHRPSVVALWERALAAGDLYQREYSGLYCTGCEAFVSETDDARGSCPAHGQPLERVCERNWFFRLTRHAPELLHRIESGALTIEPEERRSEVLSFIRSGLKDFSVSRGISRARGFGIGVPNDPEQVIYVWFDALTSYLSVLGFPEQTPNLERYFLNQQSAREHLIGKDILRFHAVYWPAILRSAGLPLPTSVKAHGFVTSRGNKIGKSLGNGVDPFALLEQWGGDAVRLYLLRHLHTTKDSDFSLERLVESHDSDLSSKVGNLLQRTASIALRHPGLATVRTPRAETDADRALERAAERALGDVRAAVDDFALHQALIAIFELSSAANRYADEQAPWVLSRRLRAYGDERGKDEVAARLGHVLWHLFESLRVIAVLLAPFLPNAATLVVERLGLSRSTLKALDQARFGVCSRFVALPGPPPFPKLADRLSGLNAEG